jgi:hypothetical protein
MDLEKVNLRRAGFEASWFANVGEPVDGGQPLYLSGFKDNTILSIMTDASGSTYQVMKLTEVGQSNVR